MRSRARAQGATDAADELRVAPRSVLWSVCPFILANEFCERLAY